jgi:hypothetical protein
MLWGLEKREEEGRQPAQATLVPRRKKLGLHAPAGFW